MGRAWLGAKRLAEDGAAMAAGITVCPVARSWMPRGLSPGMCDVVLCVVWRTRVDAGLGLT